MTNINKTHLLKQYQSQITKLNSEIAAMESELAVKKKEITVKHQAIKELKNKIKSLETKQVIVSEHAMLRYFERVLNFDLEDIKAQILTESTLELMDKLGTSGQYPVKEGGFSIIVKNNTVTTIV